jgi:hypothetical protein
MGCYLYLPKPPRPGSTLCSFTFFFVFFFFFPPFWSLPRSFPLAMNSSVTPAPVSSTRARLAVLVMSEITAAGSPSRTTAAGLPFSYYVS